jgi:predicted ATPase with chaperone activity
MLDMQPVDVEPEESRTPGPPSAAPPLRRAAPAASERSRYVPEAPHTIAATGLSGTWLEELCLKHLFQTGDLRGGELSQRTCLPQALSEELLERLRKNKLVDIKGSLGTGLGRSQMIFTMTEAGHRACMLSMERDRYVGPAPVPFATYAQAVSAQTIRGNRLRRGDLETHFADLVVQDATFDAIGPAMNSGKALFFYGPPGNGKTAICQRMTHCFGGDVYVPHAVLVDDYVIRVFDETIHQRVAVELEGTSVDERWVRVKRPMVIVGGELMLEDLDLRYSQDVKFYEAPFQLKANCGMLLIDDFGRQKVSPKDLLNRWIVPLESEFDFLTMHTGKKLQVPFDVFVVFSTNLDPKELVDGAFMRRVRYKLEVSRPEASQFTAIFKRECERKKVKWDPAMIGYLVRKHYQGANRPFNACEPRDLLAQVADLCAYRGHEPRLTEEILDRVVANYFVRF